MRNAVICILVALSLLGGLAGASGSVPGADEVVKNLAHRPDVKDQFRSSAHGRFDASVFLFTCVLLTPFAVLAGVVTLAVGHMALEATVLPVGRRLGFSDRAVVVSVLLAVSLVAYAQADLWVPRSLRLLGLIARAWVVSTT